MGIRFLQMAVVYFLIGLGFGLYMAISENHGQMPVHAHINLLGWVSMAIFGIVYEMYPRLKAHWLAPVHFWLYAIGAPVAMVGLFFLMRGEMAMAPAAGIGSMALTAGALAFAINILLRLPGAQRA